jgi:hypothetical protein
MIWLSGLTDWNGKAFKPGDVPADAVGASPGCAA